MANEVQTEYVNRVTLSDGTDLIDLSKDDVKPEHVQAGVKFHAQSGKPEVGTNTKTVDASGVTTSPDEVLVGKKFGKGNSIETGRMPDKSGTPIIVTPAALTNDGQGIDVGYYGGGNPVKFSDEDKQKLIPANIKKGTEVLGMVGTFGAEDMSAHAKAADPSFVEQIIKPDAGYDFLTAVTVNPIRVTRTNNGTGVTVTIG